MLSFAHYLELEFTAVNTDCLSGTSLDQPPADGSLFLQARSTVNTATITGPQYNAQEGRTMLLKKGTDGIPNATEDPWWVVPVNKGKRPVIVLGGTTGTVHLCVGFIPARRRG